MTGPYLTSSAILKMFSFQFACGFPIPMLDALIESFKSISWKILKTKISSLTLETPNDSLGTNALPSAEVYSESYETYKMELFSLLICLFVCKLTGGFSLFISCLVIDFHAFWPEGVFRTLPNTRINLCWLTVSQSNPDFH